MIRSPLPALALLLCGAASPAAAQTCPSLLPDGFNGALAHGAGAEPLVEVRGSADVAGAVRVAPATRFNLASVGKMLTAVAVGQLVDKGQMAFDAPIGRYLPDLPPDVASLRIEQLMSHTAGLPLFLRDDLATAIAKAPDARSLVPLVLAERRKAPGEFQYSNAGYVLVGAAVEAVSGLTYREYIAARVLPAAGIAPQAIRWEPGDAEGVDRESAASALSFSRLPTWPAGGMVLSAPDLWRFGRALATGRLVRPETLEQMMAGGIELRPAQDGKPASRYGLGFGVSGSGTARVIGHTGGAPGVDAALRIELASGRTVAVLSNHSGTDDLNAGVIAKATLAKPPEAVCER